MADNKARFIASELPKIDEEIKRIEQDIRKSKEEKNRLSELVQKSGSYETINDLIVKLNEKYKEKGALEQSIKQIEDSEAVIFENKQLLNEIDEGLYSANKKALVQNNMQ